MTTTAIRNLSRTLEVLNLPRSIAPKRAMVARTVTHLDGTSERKDVRVIYGDSIHLRAGETKGGFPNAIRQAPDIIVAVRQGRIALIEEADPVSSTDAPSDIEVAVEVPLEIQSEPEQVSESNDDARGAPASKPFASKPGDRGKTKAG